MRVTIDAVPLLVRSAGVKNYLYYWIQHLRRAAGSHEIATFPPLDPLPPIQHDASVAGRGPTLRALAELALSNRTPLPILRWRTRGSGVFHASSLVWRPPRSTRLTATIHDVTSWLLPELHSAGNRRADENFARLAHRADRLIAVSACTRDDAVRVLGIPHEKICVIHSGIAEAFFDPPKEAVQAVKKRYRLDRPFALFVGTIEPRKNLDTLFDAWESLPSATRREFDLVVAGPGGWATPATLARLRKFRYLGYVPEADLAPLTAGAVVFAYPSLYEGFGFPVAQAMAAGVPVVTSNLSSLPEVAGGAAILVDPRSPAELGSALERVLHSEALRADLVHRGRARAAEFRWDACARKSVAFFERVAGL